jgi:hypothetical protein
VGKVLPSEETRIEGVDPGLSHLGADGRPSQTRALKPRTLPARSGSPLSLFQSDHSEQLSSSIANHHSVLQEFVRRSQPWGRERVPLPRQLRRALWALIPLQLLWAIWLVTILSGSSPCEGPICTVATLNHHSAILLACGVICLIGLVGLAIPTRGLSRCNGREVTGLTLAATAGGASLLGIAALIIGALIALIVLGAFALGFSATS